MLLIDTWAIHDNACRVSPQQFLANLRWLKYGQVTNYVDCVWPYFEHPV